jgi:PAS domain S-box-containing protein
MSAERLVADMSPESKTSEKSSSRSLDEAAIELTSARALLAAIVESSEDGIVSKTLDGIVTSWNAGAERLFGFTAAEMIGQSIKRIIPTELHGEEDRILAQLRRGQRLERYETERLHKDGRRLRISLTVSPVLDDSGNIIGAAKVAHDVTALRQHEAQLKQAAADREQLLESERAARAEAERLSHVKDEFLAMLSHELRTPLNAIQGWTEILRHPKASTQDFSRGIEIIDRNVRAQTQIVNDLLDMSRIDSGQIHLEVRSMDLVEVIHGALEAARPSADAKRIRIQTLLDSRVGAMRGDPHRLQQVLWNLVSNAVKFTPAGGGIQVSLERVHSHLEIAVQDSGIGIPAEFLPHVFERFRQADAGIGRRYGGLGLGLSIVKSLVELHGGTVRVKSAGQDRGSTFIVALPVHHVRTDDASPLPRAGTHPLDAIGLPALENTSVLIVEDDADGRALLARIVESRGARTQCATRTHSGKSRCPDAVRHKRSRSAGTTGAGTLRHPAERHRPARARRIRAHRESAQARHGPPGADPRDRHHRLCAARRQAPRPSRRLPDASGQADRGTGADRGHCQPSQLQPLRMREAVELS